MIETKSIGIWQGNLVQVDRSFKSIKSIDLPLSQNGQVTRILSAYMEYNPKSEIEIDMEPSHIFEYEEQG